MSRAAKVSRSRKTEKKSGHTIAAALVDDLMARLTEGPLQGDGEPVDTELESAISHVCDALLAEREPTLDHATAEEREELREMFERDAAYIVGVQVGLRLRGVR